MVDKREVIVKVEVPLCVDDRALQRPGLVLGWDSARTVR